MTLADRRRITSQLYLTNCYTIEALATELHERYGFPFSESVVKHDLAYMTALAEARATRSISEWVESELKKLDNLEQMIMGGQHIKVAAEKIDDEKDLDVVAALEEAESSIIGIDAKTAETLLKIQESRRRLLGLDAPKKLAVEGGDPNRPVTTASLSDEQIEAILESQTKQKVN